jgi:hypothetical protein
VVGVQHSLQFFYSSCLCKTSDDTIDTNYISDTTTTTVTTNNPITAANSNNNINNLYVNFLQEVLSSVLEILAATYSPKTQKKVTISKESEHISKF